MIRFFATITFLLSLIAALGLFSPAYAKTKAEIVNIAVSSQGETLGVSFRILNCFTPDMDEAILSGVRTTFRIRLAVDRPGFLNSSVSDLVLERSIKYDLLQNEFYVYLPEHPGGVRITGKLEEAKQWMSHIRDLPVVPVRKLSKGESYQLRVKVELSKLELPFFLRYVFFFASLWDFETDWYQITFKL